MELAVERRERCGERNMRGAKMALGAWDTTANCQQPRKRRVGRQDA